MLQGLKGGMTGPSTMKGGTQRPGVSPMKGNSASSTMTGGNQSLGTSPLKGSPVSSASSPNLHSILGSMFSGAPGPFTPSMSNPGQHNPSAQGFQGIGQGFQGQRSMVTPSSAYGNPSNPALSGGTRTSMPGPRSTGGIT